MLLAYAEWVAVDKLRNEKAATAISIATRTFSSLFLLNAIWSANTVEEETHEDPFAVGESVA